MAGAETALEIGWLAEEVAKGTAVTTPTKRARKGGILVPKTATASGAEAGTLAGVKRKTRVKKWSEWDTDQNAFDVNTFPFWARKFLNGSVSAPTTPGGGTLPRLWTFPRTILSDNLKSTTITAGDPNFQVWQAAYGMVDQAVFSADASSEDPVQEQYNGTAQFPTEVSTPAAPSAVDFPLLIPSLADMYIDAGTGATIGTTAVAGQLLSAELTVPTGVTYKYLAQGAAGTLSFAATGRETTSPHLALVIHLSDLTQYNHWKAGDYLKIRIRLNAEANAIETGFTYYLEYDIFGVLDDDFNWGDTAGSNRTIEIAITGQEDTTAATDLIMRCQNKLTTV
jgi:hypothetical protein